MTEIPIQKDVLDYLKTIDTLKVWRSNAGRIKGGPIMAPKGCPDIIGYAKSGRWIGKFLGFEVKQPGKALTQDQKEWQKEMFRDGCFYAVVTSVEDMRQLVEVHFRDEHDEPMVGHFGE